jgi:hypothetical protein
MSGADAAKVIRAGNSGRIGQLFRLRAQDRMGKRCGVC